MDSVSKNVGIATSNPRYPLDVNGILNAKGYLINGEDIESFFSWASNGNSLYYNKGNVGIGTATPSAELHVVGTINAQGFLKGNQELTEYLKDFLYWTRSPDGSSNIYFLGDNGKRKVGIGVTTNMKEKLEINGGLVISDSIQTRSKVAGTIEYNSVQDKFIGYGKDGTGYSLNEIQTTGDLVVDGVVLWSADKKLTNSNKLVFKDNKLGIATANPEALLAIQGDGETSYIAFDDAQGNSVFYISPSGNIGIGKAAPQYALDVKGVVDATDFLINGSPIQFQKGDSFWSLGNSDETGTDLFYVNGNVGIGTNDPNSLLELASTKDDVRLTFDIAGDDLFTLGIDESAPERFIISEGSDLSDPVFVFEGDTIGVGTHYPKTNLHVSGNAGFLVEGEFDVFAPQRDSSLDLDFTGLLVTINQEYISGNVYGLYVDLSDLESVYVPNRLDSDVIHTSKIAGLFQGGAVSIVATGNEALQQRVEFHVSSNAMDKKDDFLIGSNVAPSFHVSGNRIGLGSRNETDGFFKIASSSSTLMLVKNNEGDTLLQVNQNGVGIGVNSNEKALYVKGKTGDTSLLSVSDKIKLTPLGLGIGVDDVDALLQVEGIGSSDLFRISRTDRGAFFGVTHNEQLYFLSESVTENVNFRVIVNGDIGVGDNLSRVREGTEVGGFYVQEEGTSNMVAFGFKEEASTVTSSIIYGGKNGGRFGIDHVLLGNYFNMLTFSATKNLGVFNTNPQYVFDMKAVDSVSNIMRVGIDNGKGLAIDAQGFVGINTEFPLSELEVSGNLRAESLVNKPKGTLLTVPGIILEQDSLTQNITLSRKYGGSDAFTLETIKTTLSVDFNNNAYGYYIKMDSKDSERNFDGSVVGVDIDVERLIAYEVDALGTQSSFSHAAVFFSRREGVLDTKVAIDMLENSEHQNSYRAYKGSEGSGYKGNHNVVYKYMQSVPSADIKKLLEAFESQYVFDFVVSNNIGDGGAYVPLSFATGRDPYKTDDGSEQGFLRGRVGFNIGTINVSETPDFSDVFVVGGSLDLTDCDTSEICDKQSYRVEEQVHNFRKYRVASSYSKNADFRLGKYTPAGREQAGFERKIIFSGGGRVSDDGLADSENLDILTMGRTNGYIIGPDSNNVYQSKLEIVLKEGADELDAFFQAGKTQESGDNEFKFDPILWVGGRTIPIQEERTKISVVGIGSGWNEMNAPSALFHIRGKPGGQHSYEVFSYAGEEASCLDSDTVEDCDYFKWWAGFANQDSLTTWDDFLINYQSYNWPSSLRSPANNVTTVRIQSETTVPLSDKNKHVAILEADYDLETNSDLAILALRYTNLYGQLSPAQNFITFLSNGGTLDAPALASWGSIEGNTGGGIQFSSPEQDYAEYILKRNPDEEIAPGDVVGVYGGQVTLDTEGADSVMVVSTSPIVIGNWPGDDMVHLYSLVAFLGQVPVKVRGEVKKGDILVSSGHQDGSAIAFSPHEVPLDMIPNIVGRSWESHLGEGTGHVNTLIGFPFHSEVVNKRLEALQDDIDSYEQSTEHLKEQFEDQLRQQDKLIERLKNGLSIVETEG